MHVYNPSALRRACYRAILDHNNVIRSSQAEREESRSASWVTSNSDPDLKIRTNIYRLEIAIPAFLKLEDNISNKNLNFALIYDTNVNSKCITLPTINKEQKKIEKRTHNKDTRDNKHDGQQTS